MMVWGNMKKILAGGFVAGCMMMVSTTTMTGCLTDDKQDSVPVVVVKDTLKTATATMGAQANADYGSFVDVDMGFKTMKLTDAKAMAVDVDLIFAYSGSAKAAAIYSPKTARDGVTGGAGGFDFLQTGFTALVATEIMTVSATKLAAVTTQAGLDSLHAAGVMAPEGRLTISNGVAFTVKSTKGKVFGATVTGLTVTAGTETAATVVIKGMGKW